jgi:hypothetical protein
MTLRKSALRVIKVQVVLTTKKLCEVWMDEGHRSLIDRIKELDDRGLTNAQVAAEFNRQGVKSRRRRDFYAELAGALVSKYNRTAASKFVDVKVKIFVENAANT